MASTGRRDFLKAAGTILGAAATSAFPPVIQRALAIAANNESGSIKDIQHVVILMQENRSFDNYFGTLRGVRGFGDRFPIPLAGGLNVFQQSNGNRILLPYHLDSKKGNAQRVDGTPHSWSDAQNAWSNGQINRWPLFKRDQSMGFYSEVELPFQFALANAFTLCDAYHCSLHGGTNPNRLFHWNGTNGPTANGTAMVVNEWDDFGPATQGHTWTTYPERLQKAGVSWKVYQNIPDNYTDNPLVGFQQYRRAAATANPSVVKLSDLNGVPAEPWTPAMEASNPLYKGVGNTMPEGQPIDDTTDDILQDFRKDVDGGLLPQISWLIAPEAYCEHPSTSSPVQGSWYTQTVLEILTANPEIWSKTALIINFDENDGYFDHVPSPAAPSINADGSLAGASTLSAAQLAYEYFNYPGPLGSHQPKQDGNVFGPGPRVPCYVVSPWTRGGGVCSQVFDHTSVVQFLEQRFGVVEPNISPYRRAICGDLTSAFNFISPNAYLPELPTLTQIAADQIRLSQSILPQVPRPAVIDQTMPRQAGGTRRSRALPYVLNVTSSVDRAANAIALNFANRGAAGAVFHVYEQLSLHRIPRRYAVEAGKALLATFALDTTAGQYDLWVVGPNGFHRHFGGWSVSTAPTFPEVLASYDKGGVLNLTLVNKGRDPCTFHVVANAYDVGPPAEIIVQPGHQTTLTRSMADFGNWYDYSVTLANDPKGFLRRVAGRIETGRHSISDPALGMDGIVPPLPCPPGDKVASIR